MMHRVLHSRRHQPQILSIPFAAERRSTRKRRLSVSIVPSSDSVYQRRFYGNTFVNFLPYPSSSSGGTSLLPPPTILYSDNHILAVNKPAGWHSIPNIPKKRKKSAGKYRKDENTNADEKNANSSIIISSNSSNKCLLSHLQQRRLGGGSQRDFLVPLHRIDQPCTGVLLFGKTSKAASRVTKVWKGKKLKRKISKERDTQLQESTSSTSTNRNHTIRRGVLKDYLCVVSTSRISALEEASVAVSKISSENTNELNHHEFSGFILDPLAESITPWRKLNGLMLRQSAEEQNGRNRQQWQRKQQQRYYKDRLRKGRSVRIIRPSDHPDDAFFEYDHDTDNSLMRPVHALWKVVDVPSIDPSYTLLLVRTSEGARHMVRALLAQVGECPILGDVRYWRATRHHSSTGTTSSDDNDHNKGPLKDRSVALHAYGVYFDRSQLRLGSLDTFEFRAPVPPNWDSFFGIRNNELQTIL